MFENACRTVARRLLHAASAVEIFCKDLGISDMRVLRKFPVLLPPPQLQMF